MIPTHTEAYDTLSFLHPRCIYLYKKVGYTPLQVIKYISPHLSTDEASACTYVGRLDPMAEGWMHVLWSGDANEKKELASQDKLYEIDVVCGVGTDTGDALGMVTDFKRVEIKNLEEVVQGFVGPFTFPYPKFSSPHIKNTLKGEDVVKKFQQGDISKIELVKVEEIENLHYHIESKLSHCHMDGDFRLEKIQKEWDHFFQKESVEGFTNVKLRVYCSSGTYMRTLAEEIGKKLDAPAFALHIKRIGVGKLIHN